MKKIHRITAAALLLGMTTTMSAQLSLSDRMYLRMEQSRAAGSRSGEKLSNILAFAKIAKGFTKADLEAEGVHVSNLIGDIALVNVAADDVERVAALPCIERLEISRRVRPTMDRARAAS